jgi:hypothetical protein
LKARIHIETAHIHRLYRGNTPQTVKSGQETDLSHTDLCLQRLKWKCEYPNISACQKLWSLSRELDELNQDLLQEREAKRKTRTNSIENTLKHTLERRE